MVPVVSWGKEFILTFNLDSIEHLKLSWGYLIQQPSTSGVLEP